MRPHGHFFHSTKSKMECYEVALVTLQRQKWSTSSIATQEKLKFNGQKQEYIYILPPQNI